MTVCWSFVRFQCTCLHLARATKPRPKQYLNNSLYVRLGAETQSRLNFKVEDVDMVKKVNFNSQIIYDECMPCSPTGIPNELCFAPCLIDLDAPASLQPAAAVHEENLFEIFRNLMSIILHKMEVTRCGCRRRYGNRSSVTYPRLTHGLLSQLNSCVQAKWQKAYWIRFDRVSNLCLTLKMFNNAFNAIPAIFFSLIFA